MRSDLAAMRQHYQGEFLLETEVSPDPFAQFSAWFEAAMAAKILEPNAMTLATASPDGQPTARTVLLKAVENQGFVFFTNYASRKAQDLAANPKAALLFNWLDLHRQIRIEGLVEKIAQADSLAYFQTRPRGSQIGGWASPQSQVISDRAFLENRVAELEEKFAGDETLPLPPTWGGYVLKPQLFEFWQGQPSRLHDRIQYVRQNGSWQIERLAP